MLIRPAELERIRGGEVDLAFRRWDRPRLLVGTRMRTAIGLVEVTSVEEVALDAVTDDEAVRAGAGSRDDLLDRLDRASRRGPWTGETLDVIDRFPATRAPDLAEGLGRDTVSFKRDVRKLKELGLTESLGTGYRLSPRGRSLAERVTS